LRKLERDLPLWAKFHTVMLSGSFPLPFLALNFTQSKRWGLGSATDAIPLPEPKPRAVGLLLIVPPIRSREVACAQWSRVGHREDALQPLDFSNALFSVHPSQYLTERQGGQFGATTPSVEFAHNQNRLFS